MGDTLARALRGIYHYGRHASSAVRKISLRARYPGLTIHEPVYIGPGCDVQVARAATLTVRGCHVARGVTLIAGEGAALDIGADFIGANSTIVAREAVTIGDGSKVAENVVVRDGNHDHDVPLRSMRFMQSPVVIGADEWLGAASIVLSGVTVGDHATVAAGAVVTKDVNAGATVAGVPARPLAYDVTRPRERG